MGQLDAAEPLRGRPIDLGPRSLTVQRAVGRRIQAQRVRAIGCAQTACTTQVQDQIEPLLVARDVAGMRGTLVRRVWQHDPTIYAPPRHRRACGYDVFVPAPIAGIEVALIGNALASMSEADAAIRALNSRADPALAPSLGCSCGPSQSPRRRSRASRSMLATSLVRRPVPIWVAGRGPPLRRSSATSTPCTRCRRKRHR
jgi:hypothetical protein